MDLSDKDIEDFRQAWLRDFGEFLSEAEARYRASRLMEFLLVLAQPPPDTGTERHRQDTL